VKIPSASFSAMDSRRRTCVSRKLGRSPNREGLIGLVFLLVFVGASCVDAAESLAAAGWEDSTASSSASGGQSVLLRTILQAGRLDDLRWPDFSDVRVPAEAFYRTLGFKSAWMKGPQPGDRAREMIGVLEQAGREGLRPEDYDGPRWAERLTRLEGAHSADDEIRFDAALTICTMRYASAVRIGRINPKHLHFSFDVEHKRLNLPEFVRLLLADKTDLKTEFTKIEPPFITYKATRAALLKYLTIAPQDDGTKLPVPANAILGTVFPGNSYDALPQLIKRLRLVGDLPSDAVPDAKTYSGTLVEAVKRFQSRHGLRTNGYLNKETIEEINVPLSGRIEQICLALERYRWLRYNFTQPPVVVNIPEFRLYAFNSHERATFTMKVNVGDSYEFQTPVFENYIRYIVFRPYWNIPPKILRNEVIPDIASDRSYVEDNAMEIVTPAGQLVASGKISDTVLQQLRAGKLTIRQKPGPENSLGLIKIMFPNEHHVYLHDTPASSDMFAGGQRSLSHGCIHLEQPGKLAAWLLRDRPDWGLERVEEAMHRGRDNVTVNLSRPIPILLFYVTAVPEPDGEIHFYRDIYGHDVTLEAALARGYPYPD
jgi:L,D-transpeptidase YcbB